MTIVIDIGNTRAKVATYTDGFLTLRAAGTDLPWEELLSESHHVLLSTVTPVPPTLQKALQGTDLHTIRWDSPEVSHYLSNVPAGMGSDRVAADIGALALVRQNHPECDAFLVIDAGTCLTFDLVGIDRQSGVGTILGGTISPGIQMRLRAMHQFTAALPLLDTNGPAPVLGTDTETAMRGGAVNGLCWEIEGYIRHLLQTYPHLRVFSTGGDTLHFPADLQPLITIQPQLIMQGLVQCFETAL